MQLTLSLFLQISTILITIIYLITINNTKGTIAKKTFKSNYKARFTAFLPSNETISDEEALNYLPK